MGILGDVERILDAQVAAYSRAHPVDRRVLVGTHVDDAVVALILHRTRGVVGMHGSIAGLEVVARSGLVAEAPDGHAGVVDTGHGHGHHAAHVLVAELRHVAQAGIAIKVFVALDIGFSLEPDAVLVAEIIEIGVVGIVGRTHMVYVGALHHHHLVLHLLACDGMAACGVGLMAVDTLELQRLPVDEEIAASQSELVVLGSHVAYLHRAEACLGAHRLDGVALLVTQFADKRIDVGLLGRPGLHVCHRDVSVACHGVALGQRQRTERRRQCLPLAHGVAIELVGKELEYGGIVFGILAADVGQREVYGQLARAVGLPGGDDLEVAHVYLRLAVDSHRAEDTRQTEHVLRFEKRTVGRAVDLHGHLVLAGVGPLANVELGHVARVLGAAHIVAVDPEIEKRVDTVEADIGLAALPRGGQGERAPVGAHLVAVFVGGVVLRRFAHHALAPVAHGTVILEDDPLVDIDGRAVFLRAILLQAIDVPRHGHIHLIPSLVRIAHLEEVLGTGVGVLGEVELPFTVEAHPIAGLLGKDALGLALRGETGEAGMGLQLVEAHQFGLLPLLSCGSGGQAILVARQTGLGGQRSCQKTTGCG